MNEDIKIEPELEQDEAFLRAFNKLGQDIRDLRIEIRELKTAVWASVKTQKKEPIKLD